VDPDDVERTDPLQSENGEVCLPPCDDLGGAGSRARDEATSVDGHKRPTRWPVPADAPRPLPR
jgi:hypothetical protein